MSDEQHGHGSIINTPKQLIAAILAGFLVPIIGIVLLVQLVTNEKRSGAGSDAQSPEAVAARLQPVGDVGYTFKEAPAAKAGEGAAQQAAAPQADAAQAAAPQAAAPQADAAQAAAPQAGAAPAASQQAGAAPAADSQPSIAAATASAAAASAAAAGSAAKAADAAAQTVKVSAEGGKKLYESACLACHGAGIAGAPKVGDKGAWAERIAKGNESLYKNAINGYQGKNGVMPAKGGAQASDDEVKAAVDYMVSASK